ncbi:MAG TPA: DUF4440 domain-containing protein [Vicinamibacterales bacterium]
MMPFSTRPVFRSVGWFLLLLVFSGHARQAPAAQAPLPPGADSQMSAEALLMELNPRGGAALVKAWHGDDPEAVAAFYTADAVLIDERGTVYRGRADILSGFLRRWVPAIRTITPTIEHVAGGMEQMTLVGSYTARVIDQEGSSYDAQGVFSNTWVRQADGSWKVRASLNTAPSRRSGTAGVPRRTLAAETVRVVRFHVKPEERESFERFFWESLRPAAAKRADVQVEDLDLARFRLLIPSKPNPQGYFTSYVLADPAGGALGGGDVMRDMVLEAVPGDEGLGRVRRWMESIVLEAPFAPAGEDFVQADLRNPRVPTLRRD